MNSLSGLKRLSRKGLRKKRRVFVSDFETTTDPNDCRVWGWGTHEVGSTEGVTIGTSIDDFVIDIAVCNSVTFFHNLRFDGMFLMDWLLRNGYVHVSGRRTRPGVFQTLISDMGQFYSITVHWANGAKTEFRDSAKKLPMTIAGIAKTFDLPMMKGEIDYHRPRPVGYVPDEVERDYIKNDVLILSHAIGQVLDSGMRKLTVGSDSLADYKKTVGDKMFGSLFPILSHTMDSEIRRAYRGGFTYCDPRFKGQRTGSGVVLDVNSLYPHVMYSALLPHSEPQFVSGVVESSREYPLTIFSVTFTAKLKPDHVPCIQIKGTSRFNETEYLTEISEPTNLMVTNVDWELYNDHYDITVIEWCGGWRFRAATGMFNDYIDKWSAVKENSDGGRRAIAKLHLNSLYGKYATNPVVASKYPELVDGKIKLIRTADERREPVYTAVGVFITSYARDITIRAAQQNYSVFAYADTDSLHLLTDEIPDNIDVHPTRMGAWKLEYHFESALFIRAKAYLERLPDGTYSNAIAGLPVNISSFLTFDDIKPGAVIHGKLVPRTVPGGVVLTDTPYEIKM